MTIHTPAAPPHLTYLRIRNYRALRDVELRDLTPLSVLIGPNGSGKSTVLDALAFLAEAVSGNLTQAWEKRNRFQGMRTRGGKTEWFITFELEAYLGPDTPRLYYRIRFDERGKMVLVSDEILREPEGESETLIQLTDAHPLPAEFAYYDGIFRMNVYDRDDDSPFVFQSPSDRPIIGYTASFPEHSGRIAPKTLALARLLTSYRHIHLTDDHKRGISDAGPRERLSSTGDNLPNVLYYLHLHHPAVLADIAAELKHRIPALADVLTEVTSDERLLLRFRDVGSDRPLPAAAMSDGTLRLVALLTLLREPGATGALGLEEPESELHPRLLPGLAEELIGATATRQLLVATHSPALLNSLAPEQVWVLHRDAAGHTQATAVAQLPGIAEMVAEGALLGDLWRSNFFEVGDPLAPLSPDDAA